MVSEFVLILVLAAQTQTPGCGPLGCPNQAYVMPSIPKPTIEQVSGFATEQLCQEAAAKFIERNKPAPQPAGWRPIVQIEPKAECMRRK